MIPIELDIQFVAPHADLEHEMVELWVKTAVSAVLNVYEDIDLLAPYQKALFTIRFCDTEEGQSLNQQFRDKDYATNVLTFEYGIDSEGTVSSDIIICVPVLENEAEEQQKPFLHHAAHLCIHGVLHSLGYDHIEEEEAEEMEELEIEILQELAIANPYSD